jgi:hypothetical protein
MVKKADSERLAGRELQTMEAKPRLIRAFLISSVVSPIRDRTCRTWRIVAFMDHPR